MSNIDVKIEEAIESAYGMERREGFLCLQAIRSAATFAAGNRRVESSFRASEGIFHLLCDIRRRKDPSRPAS